MIREILDQRSGKSPQLKGSRESTLKPKTVAQLLAEKRAIVPVFSPKLELHLQMIAEQKRVRKEGPTTGTVGSRGQTRVKN